MYNSTLLHGVRLAIEAIMDIVYILYSRNTNEKPITSAKDGRLFVFADLNNKIDSHI